MFESKSSTFFASEQPNVLKIILANAETHKFNGLDHFGPDKTGPKEVAKIKQSFFKP